MSFKQRIQQLKRAGNRPQSAELNRRVTNAGTYWVTRYRGERLEATSLEGLCSAIAAKADGEPVEVV